MNAPTHNTPQETAFRDHVNSYLEKGLKPLPIEPGTKKPCPYEWQKTSSAPLIRSWRTEFPGAGLGLVMGTPINDNLYLNAVDIDRNDLVEPIKAILFQADDEAKPLYVSKRGSKGETIFVVSEEQLPGRKFKSSAGPGLDVLADGQQTVIPPTIHLDGMPYEWIGDCDLLDADLTNLPLIDLETVNQIEALVKGAETATVANDNSDYGDRIEYLGGGQFKGVDMVYPGNVNDTLCRMAAVAARHEYLAGNATEEARSAAVEGMVQAAIEAYERSDTDEPWDLDDQRDEAGSQYDRAMAKGMDEWGWEEPPPIDQPSSFDDQDKLVLHNPADWEGMEIPERRWLAKDYVPKGEVTSLYGKGGMGKSMIVQQLLTACAVGMDWLGLEVEPCRGIGFFCEDDLEELLRRQERINQHYGITFEEVGANLRLITRPGMDNVLMEFSKGTGTHTRIFEQLEEEARAFGAGLLIIDTAADTFAGDENSRLQTRQFLASGLTRLAKNLDATVVMCSHPSRRGENSKDGDSGSTAWSNGVRSRLSLGPLGDDEMNAYPRRILTRKKSNYGSLGGDGIEIMWDEGVFVALEPSDPETAAHRDQEVEQQALVRFMEMFLELEELGVPMAESVHSSAYFAQAMQDHFPEPGVGEKELKAKRKKLDLTMRKLVGDGLLALERRGAKKSEYLVRAPAAKEDDQAA